MSIESEFIWKLDEKKLYDAASAGDTESFDELTLKDPLLLSRVSFTCPNKTPLHVATIHRQLAIVQKIVNLNPRFAEELDSQQSSPLHIASSLGYADIVSILMLAAPDMCLSRDCQGRNPLHLAAMKGHVDVVKLIYEIVPCAIREKLDRNETVLHLCVKHRRLETLKILVPKLNDFLYEENGDGDTIFLMAVRDRRPEIIQYLSGNSNIDVNGENSKGQTAINILQHNLKLRNSKTKPKSLTKKRDTIMVVAILIATMAFQAAVSPPGGVLQEDKIKDRHNKPLPYPQWAGESIMAYRLPRAYKHFCISNSISFLTSIATILLLINGMPFKRHTLVMWILKVIMSMTLTSITATYVLSIFVVTPKRRWPLMHVLEHGLDLAIWCGIMGIVFFGNIVKFIIRRLKNRGNGILVS